MEMRLGLAGGGRGGGTPDRPKMSGEAPDVDLSCDRSGVGVLSRKDGGRSGAFGGLSGAWRLSGVLVVVEE